MLEERSELAVVDADGALVNTGGGLSVCETMARTSDKSSPISMCRKKILTNTSRIIRQSRPFFWKSVFWELKWTAECRRKQNCCEDNANDSDKGHIGCL